VQFGLSDDELRCLAEALAPLLLDRLGAGQEQRELVDGYLTPDAAARYLGVSRKRIHDLTSMRAVVPDGRDGRTPLFTRETLDAYVRGGDGGGHAGARIRPMRDVPSTKRKVAGARLQPPPARHQEE
jgi:excisionase family DNA binding protein